MNRQNRRQMLRLYLGMLLSVLLASLFFSGLYRFNNKYTQHTTQPINGLLILSEADMEQHPSRYLWHDWAYYPNVLLTPADFQDGDPDRYMTYVNLSPETAWISPDRAARHSLAAALICSAFRFPVPASVILWVCRKYFQHTSCISTAIRLCLSEIPTQTTIGTRPAAGWSVFFRTKTA